MSDLTGYLYNNQEQILKVSSSSDKKLACSGSWCLKAAQHLLKSAGLEKYDVSSDKVDGPRT